MIEKTPLTDIATVAKLPDVFLGYQKQLMQATALHTVVFCEKSRRIGVTWSIAADAVLTAASNKAAKGMDVFYIGFNLDMTKEFIDTCAEWAKSFSYIAGEVEEYLFSDIDENGTTKEIQAFRIRFDSGFDIVALTSRPRSLRGRQGYIIIDEAAFHDDLKELMKAALAMLIWGGKVLVISTHDGVGNPFNEYILESRAGRNKYHVMRIDFDEALADGLYQRICLVTGKGWSEDNEASWRQEIVDYYGEGADEELFCVPKLSSGAYLPAELVESRMRDEIPVIRLEKDKAFGQKHEKDREVIINGWCEDTLDPLLSLLDPVKFPSYVGGDFARTGDLSVIWPLQLLQNLVRWTPFVVELRNIPFRQQLQILWYIMDRLPRLSGGAFDARGNGQQMAEETKDRYGAGRIHEVMTSDKWYLDAMPKYKASLEDATFMLEKFLGANSYTPVYAIAQNDAAASVAAAGAITFTGPATASGTLNLWIAGRRIRTLVTAAQTAAQIVTGLVAAINAQTNLPVSAIVDPENTSKVNLTAKNKGECANDLDVRFNYNQDEFFPAGVSAVITAMSGGAGNPEVQDVLDVVGDEWYTDIVMSYTDSTNMAAIESELSARFGPLKMIDAHLFTGIRGGLSALMSKSETRNSPHNSWMGINRPLNPTYEWAAALGGVASYYGKIDPARPLQTLILPGILPPSIEDRFTLEERNILLHNGVSTFRVDAGGNVVIERVVTNYRENSFGALDPSYLDVETLKTLTYLRFDVRNFIALQYPRYKLADDGTNFARGDDVVTPSVVKAALIARFRLWEEAGLVENFEQFKADLIVERDQNDPNRVNSLIPPDIINGFRVFAGLVQFRL